MATEITAAGSSFVDTNVWLYALIQAQDAEKSEKAKRLVQNTPGLLASTQVINEVSVNLIKALCFGETDIRNIIAAFYNRYHIVEFNQIILRTASEFRMRYRLSFWDSLIAASAFVAGASILYTEDMHDGLVIEQQLRIENPFK
jgi:predicted nucleic acid-binding protein